MEFDYICIGNRNTSMRKFVRNWVLVAMVAILFCIDAMALDGGWRGEFTVGQMKLPLVFNFSETGTGVTTCTMDSPAQGATGIPVNVLLCTPDSLSLECKVIGAGFNGRISADSIAGKFTQRGFSFPLTLKRDAPLEERRPQTPKAPYPYTIKDTVFVTNDGVTVSGTLSIPKLENRQTVPAVVMVTGSGPQNRDEELFEHKPFAVIADYLARNGVASFRYDDRGTGKSGGDFQKGTTFTFKDDAKSALELMRTIPGIGKVGVLGHSEGGTIAFMLGAENVPDFIISLAGMAVTAKETLMAQNKRSLEKSGLSENDREACLAVISSLFDELAVQGKKGLSTSVDIDSIAKSKGVAVPPVIMASLRSVQSTRTPWFDIFVGIDPGEYISRTKCPVLAINGDKDTQVDADPNLAVVKKHCPKAEIRLMPSLNHLMQHAVTGELDEYNEIRETISPDVLRLTLDFIKKISQ